MTQQYPQARVLGERSVAVWTRAGDPEGAYHLYRCQPGATEFTVECLEIAGNISNAARRAGAGADLPPGTPSTYGVMARVQLTGTGTVLEQMRADANQRFAIKSWL